MNACCMMVGSQIFYLLAGLILGLIIGFWIALVKMIKVANEPLKPKTPYQARKWPKDWEDEELFH